MRAGELNCRVTVKQQSSTQDGIGQPVLTWTDALAGDIWAKIVHPSGMEGLKAGAVMSTVKANIRMRYRTDITAGMRVYHGATIYNIVAVLPNLTSKQYIDLQCEVTT